MPNDPDRRPRPLEQAITIVLATFATVITRRAAPNGGGDHDGERPSAHLQAIAIMLGTFAAILTWQLISQAH